MFLKFLRRLQHAACCVRPDEIVDCPSPPNGWPDRVQVGRRVLLFGSAAAAAVAAYWLSNLDLWNPANLQD